MCRIQKSWNEREEIAKKEEKSQVTDELLRQFRDYKFTIISDDNCEVILTDKHPDCIDLYKLEPFIQRLKDDVGTEAILDVVSQLKEVKGIAMKFSNLFSGYNLIS